MGEIILDCGKRFRDVISNTYIGYLGFSVHSYVPKIPVYSHDSWL